MITEESTRVRLAHMLQQLDLCDYDSDELLLLLEARMRQIARDEAERVAGVGRYGT